MILRRCVKARNSLAIYICNASPVLVELYLCESAPVEPLPH
jgi:hypothetical protein